MPIARSYHHRCAGLADMSASVTRRVFDFCDSSWDHCYGRPASIDGSFMCNAMHRDRAGKQGKGSSKPGTTATLCMSAWPFWCSHIWRYAYLCCRCTHPFAELDKLQGLTLCTVEASVALIAVGRAAQSCVHAQFESFGLHWCRLMACCLWVSLAALTRDWPMKWREPRRSRRLNFPRPRPACHQ